VNRDTAAIVVVDDETSVREALTEMLNVFGYNVKPHHSAEQGDRVKKGVTKG